MGPRYLILFDRRVIKVQLFIYVCFRILIKFGRGAIMEKTFHYNGNLLLRLKIIFSHKQSESRITHLEHWNFWKVQKRLEWKKSNRMRHIPSPKNSTLMCQDDQHNAFQHLNRNRINNKKEDKTKNTLP